MSRSVLEFARGEAGFGDGVGEVVEGVGVDLGDARADEGANKELEALEFGLDDDEAEVRLRVRVARLLFHELNLVVDTPYQPRRLRASQGEEGLPGCVSSPGCAPSGRPAMAEFRGHSAP